MIEGIAPIVFTPFDDNGDIDADGLRRIVRFEMDGGVTRDRHQRLCQ